MQFQLKTVEHRLKSCREGYHPPPLYETVNQGTQELSHGCNQSYAIVPKFDESVVLDGNMFPFVSLLIWTPKKVEGSSTFIAKFVAIYLMSSFYIVAHFDSTNASSTYTTMIHILQTSLQLTHQITFTFNKTFRLIQINLSIHRKGKQSLHPLVFYAFLLTL